MFRTLNDILHLNESPFSPARFDLHVNDADTVNWTFARLRDLDFAEPAEPAALLGSSPSSSSPHTTHGLTVAVDAARSSLLYYCRL
ncbi:hypothetical protein VTK73DRAFT_2987 [Phialemonium thermophilum]|uniref:Uncharacterized protein n=1 Tax=Phialemonium thermophilum TaxID=223376 RepID=A0ABR3Y241_9PEZI